VTGGADSFVFMSGNGNDTIGDLRVTDGDHINLTAFGLGALDPTQLADLLNILIVDNGSGTAKIDFSQNYSSLGIGDLGLGNGTILVAGWTASALKAAEGSVFLV